MYRVVGGRFHLHLSVGVRTCPNISALFTVTDRWGRGGGGKGGSCHIVFQQNILYRTRSHTAGSAAWILRRKKHATPGIMRQRGHNRNMDFEKKLVALRFELRRWNGQWPCHGTDYEADRVATVAAWIFIQKWLRWGLNLMTGVDPPGHRIWDEGVEMSQKSAWILGENACHVVLRHGV